VTAAYLACKVEEFNVSLEQFVGNINGNKERAMEIILNHELLVSKFQSFASKNLVAADSNCHSHTTKLDHFI
jgi:hypothetical protein